MKFKYKDEHKARDKTLSQEITEAWDKNVYPFKNAHGVVKVVKGEKIIKELKGNERFKK